MGIHNPPPPLRTPRDGNDGALALLALAGTAILAIFFAQPRADKRPIGRILDAGPAAGFQTGQPRAFAKDDFFLLKLDDGSLAAFYAYPPGYFGHKEGCQIRWSTDATLLRSYGQNALWIEGCSGSKWAPSGRRLFGPAPRDLDRFPVSVQNGHVIVDTRQLRCQPVLLDRFPCERVPGPVTQLFASLTDRGFQPAKLRVAAGNPAYLILKNETDREQDWHLVGVRDAAGFATGRDVPAPLATGVGAADGDDIHTPPARGDGFQTGVAFTVAKRGVYTFVSDADPLHLHGTLTAR